MLSIDKNSFKRDYNNKFVQLHGKELKEGSNQQKYEALGSLVRDYVISTWMDTNKRYNQTGEKQVYYFSMEFLLGRLLGDFLLNLGIRDICKEALSELDIDLEEIENLEHDQGLGNGGLGRLAACFIDSAAAMEIPLTGYGLRYNNGLFNQYIENGFQKEEADNWLKYGDPWSLRKDSEAVEVKFSDMVVRAIPYDTPIIGYKINNINTLRLWKCEAITEFDFDLFNSQRYYEAVNAKNSAEDITRVLYPNDSTKNGKILRLRQQYLLVSASLQDIVSKYKKKYGVINEKFADLHAVQLNDTHPTLAIPELMRILLDEEGIKFNEALSICKKVFAYTNHTILAEALEKWNIEYIYELFPRILEIIKLIDDDFIAELRKKGYDYNAIEEFKIINHGQVRMANMAIHIGSVVNGVAALHTEILKNSELNNWYKLYPEKFQNKTNGITPRRWIRLANPELSQLITRLLGSEEWITDLSQLKKLEKFADDKKVLKEFMRIKSVKKKQLASYIKEVEGVEINPYSLFDIQIKRLHEYKRQLLNGFYILDLYYRIKEDPTLDIPDVTFIFGAKAFPGYRRAKAIVKFINEIGNLINNDSKINGKIKVVFVQNYRVSYAEKLVPAADVSKQISTAGKEASGTGNMKFMLNGAPTFGTLDGANVEIVEEGGKENNFIFGLTVDEIEVLRKKYDPRKYYNDNPNLRRVVDSLINGTFNDGGTGEFRDLYNSLMNEGDQYFLLADFKSFVDVEDKIFEEFKDKEKWARKCFMNTCNAGIFSSDRTILQYAKEIWKVKRLPLN